MTVSLSVYTSGKPFLWSKGGCRDVTTRKRRETRVCLHQNRNWFLTPSLHLCLLFVCVNIFFVTKLSIVPVQYLPNNRNISERNKDIGLGLWMNFCFGVGIPLFTFFFMRWHPYILVYFREMIFPLVPRSSKKGDVKILLTDVAMCVMGWGLKKRHKDQQNTEEQPAIKIMHST